MSPREDGAGVVLSMGMMSLLIAVAGIGGGIVATIATQRQVQAAADLAVLAGASAAASGTSPCAAVARIATRNGGEVERCESDGSEVVAVVERRLPRVLGGRAVRARARAGPVGSPG